MKFAALYNGVKIPVLGYGVFQIPPSETKECVLKAIKIGYRSIDTAQFYENEYQVGEAINECGLDRDKLFITTKIRIENFGYEKACESIEKSIRDLQTDYIDLMLVHQPFNDYYGAYHALEEYYKAGKIRAIGVSNFLADRFVDIANCVEIPPMVNQIETHIFWQQKQLIPYLKKYHCLHMASEPLAQGRNNLFQHKKLLPIANNYNKSCAQIALRFLIQSGVIVIPKTVNSDRMRENFQLFDFELTEDEMNIIKTIDQNRSQFLNKRDPIVVEEFVKLIRQAQR